MSKYSDDINDQRIAAAIRSAGNTLGPIGDELTKKFIDWDYKDKDKR